MFVSISSKIMTTKFFDSIIKLRLGKTKAELYGAKIPIKVWNVDVDNIVISKLIEMISNRNVLLDI